MELRTQVVLVVVTTVVVAFVAPLLLKLARPRSRITWTLFAVDAGLVVWFLVLQADWTLCSDHLRYLPLPLAAYCTITTFPRGPAALPAPRTFPRKLGRALGFLIGLMLLALLTGMLVELHARDTTRAVALRWPLHHERGVVVQGGASELRNQHEPVPAQQRALDIVAVGAWGRRMRGMYPSKLSDYQVYGATVRAPCTGRVVQLETGQPDRPPLSPEERGHLAGNFVAIYCQRENVTVVLAHLQPGSELRLGQELDTSAVVGLVGNSGNSTEPHLHVHALPGLVRSSDDLLGGRARGVAMAFEGRRLVRGDSFAPH